MWQDDYASAAGVVAGRFDLLQCGDSPSNQPRGAGMCSIRLEVCLVSSRPWPGSWGLPHQNVPLQWVADLMCKIARLGTLLKPQ
jgi:hypothetical protein